MANEHKNNFNCSRTKPRIKFKVKQPQLLTLTFNAYVIIISKVLNSITYIARKLRDDFLSAGACRSSPLSFVLLILLTTWCSEASAARIEQEDEVLHIGGIFPINGEGGWQGGQACMPAAYLALEDVNKRKDLLPGFQLRLHSNDSEVCLIYIY